MWPSGVVTEMVPPDGVAVERDDVVVRQHVAVGGQDDARSRCRTRSAPCTEMVTTEGDAFAATAETAVAVDGLLIVTPCAAGRDRAARRSGARVDRDGDAGADAAADQRRDDGCCDDGDEEAAARSRRAEGRSALARARPARRPPDRPGGVRVVTAAGRRRRRRRGDRGLGSREVAAVGVRRCPTALVGPGGAVGHGAPSTARTGVRGESCGDLMKTLYALLRPDGRCGPPG